jgi:hypothetical protein
MTGDLNQGDRTAMPKGERRAWGGIGRALEKYLSVLSLIIAIVSVTISVRNFNRDEERVSADFMLRFNELLDGGVSAKLLGALEENENQPVLKERGGQFSELDVERLLGQFELLATACDHHLISEDMAYDAFSYYVETAFKNKEITAFLADIRKEEPGYYEGFDQLAKRFIARETREAGQKTNKTH